MSQRLRMLAMMRMLTRRIARKRRLSKLSIQRMKSSTRPSQFGHATPMTLHKKNMANSTRASQTIGKIIWLLSILALKVNSNSVLFSLFHVACHSIFLRLRRRRTMLSSMSVVSSSWTIVKRLFPIILTS